MAERILLSTSTRMNEKVLYVDRHQSGSSGEPSVTWEIGINIRLKSFFYILASDNMAVASKT